MALEIPAEEMCTTKLRQIRDDPYRELADRLKANSELSRRVMIRLQEDGRGGIVYE